MKKILILASFTRENLESGLLDAVMETWAQYVLGGRYPNIRFYAYCPMDDEERYRTPHGELGCIRVEESTVLCTQGDDLFSTFDRTRAAMRTLIQHVKWADYVLLTNASTYINVPLLNDFAAQIATNDYRVFCGRVISSKYMSGPYSWCLYGEGSALLLNNIWVKAVMDNELRKHVIDNDRTGGEKKWKFYKRNVTDTAIGCIIDDLLLGGDIADCLDLVDVDAGGFIYIEKIDHTLYWQDWGQDLITEAEPETWHVMGSVDCRGKDDAETAGNLRDVHEEVHGYYEENNYQTDMRYIDAYVNNPQTPVVTQSLDLPDCCLEDYEKIPFDDYHKWLEENSDIPNLVVNEDGELVPTNDDEEGNGGRPVNPYDQWGQVIPKGMTYAQYFNIPFWNHKCWYRHPWAGDNFCGCCRTEQLVYPQGSPSHEHDGKEDCGYGSNSGSGSSSGGGSGSGSGSNTGCECFDWTVV